MVEMYKVNTNNHNVEIDGFPFFAEEIKSNESFVRRELKRTKIMSGTEFVERGNYIPVEYSFTTTVNIPPENPDIHDKIFTQLSNKICTVICPAMGGMFQAEVIIKKNHTAGMPDRLKLDITVKEVAEKNRIPKDEVKTPSDEVLQ